MTLLRRVFGLFALMSLAIVASQVAAAAAEAASLVPPLVPSFTIENGAGFTNKASVGVGDAGFSPFFRPAVLVWDGGSIIGGSNVGAADDLKSQTARLLPHPCQSIESISSNAMLADMIAAAPTEVDARCDPDADADVVMVMGGGGDLKGGRDVVSTFADLERYCEGRRAAGFKTVVLTLLPRSQPASFETSRLALNALIRENWAAFADGLADVAADGRIGDTGDDLDRQYYSADALHPTAAGYAVMAAITAPVLNALDWRSDGCDTRYAGEDAVFSDWRPYAAALTWQLSPGDGVKTVDVEYRDESGTIVAASDSIVLDTVGPVTTAPRNAAVRRGAVATLFYRVTDAPPAAPTAGVTIRVRNRAGTVVKKLSLGQQMLDVRHLARFRCQLWPGSYRFSVYARDAAGNAQSRLGSARLVVYRP